MLARVLTMCAGFSHVIPVCNKKSLHLRGCSRQMFAPGFRALMTHNRSRMRAKGSPCPEFSGQLVLLHNSHLPFAKFLAWSLGTLAHTITSPKPQTRLTCGVRKDIRVNQVPSLINNKYQSPIVYPAYTDNMLRLHNALENLPKPKVLVKLDQIITRPILCANLQSFVQTSFI